MYFETVSPAASDQELLAAAPLVAPAAALWGELVDEMSRFAACSVDGDCPGVLVRGRGELTARLFLLSAPVLRYAFLLDRVHLTRIDASHPPVERLPAWFTDEVFETIGSRNEPFDEPFVHLVGTELIASAHAHNPGRAAADLPGVANIQPRTFRWVRQRLEELKL